MKRPQDDRVKILRTGIDGGCGEIKLPRPNKKGFTKASIIWSCGDGWEHVSVRPYNGTMPHWEDMCLIKEIFWRPEECVIQYHPAQSDYVNIADNCLHLWRPVNQEIPTPPLYMV